MSFLSGNTQSAPNEPRRPLNVDRERVATNQEAVPLPYVIGKTMLGCTYITQALDDYTEAVTSSVGKGEQATTGYDYYASGAAVICLGPIDALDVIRADDKIIWEGPLTRGTEDSVELTTKKGKIRFFWGRMDQGANAYLDGLGHPPYRGVCYCVLRDFYLGRNRTTFPNLEFMVTRHPDLSATGVTVASAVGDDANPVMAAVELLTDKRFGLGLPASMLDVQAFDATAQKLLDEGLGISPFIPRAEPARQLLVKLAEYFDGYIRIDAGQLEIGVVEAVPSDTSGLTSINEDVLLEPPTIKVGSWADTANVIQVAFNERNFQRVKEQSVVMVDQANFQITGRRATMNVQREWAATKVVAQRIAKALARAAGIPSLSGSAVCRADAAEGLQVGDLFLLDCPTYSIEIVARVQGKTTEPEHDRIDLEWVAMQGLDSVVAGDAPDDDDDDDTTTIAPITQRMIWELPWPFVRDDLLTIATIAARPSVQTTGYNVHRSYDASSYQLMAGHDRFGIRGTLNAEYTAVTYLIDDQVGMVVDLDGIDADVLASITLAESLAYKWFVLVNDEVMALRDVEVTGANQVRLTGLIRNRYDTLRETHAAGSVVWFVQKDDLNQIQDDPSFALDSVQYFKLQAGAFGVMGALADATALEHTFEARTPRPIHPVNASISAGVGETIIAWSIRHWNAPNPNAGFTPFVATFTVPHVVEIWTADGLTLKRSISVASGQNSTAYSDANRTADFGNTTTQFLARVYSYYGAWKSRKYDEVLS